MLTNLNSVPTSLRQIPRWVLWHKYLERKSGKWKKCPWRVDLQRESKRLEPDGWGTSEKALAAFQESGERMNGLGLWLDGSDDLVCIDLDSCLKFHTADDRRRVQILPWARHILDVSANGDQCSAYRRAWGRLKGFVSNLSTQEYPYVTGS